MKYSLLISSFLFSSIFFLTAQDTQKVYIEETLKFSQAITQLKNTCKVNDHELLLLGSSYDGRKSWVKRINAYNFKKIEHFDIAQSSFRHLDKIIPVASFGYIINSYNKGYKKSQIKAYDHKDQLLWQFETPSFNCSNAFIDPNNSDNLILYGTPKHLIAPFRSDTCRVLHFDFVNQNVTYKKNIISAISSPTIHTNGHELFVSHESFMHHSGIKKFDLYGNLKWTRNIDFIKNDDFYVEGDWLINKKGNLVFVIYEWFEKTLEDYVFYEYDTDDFTKINSFHIPLAGRQYTTSISWESIHLSIDEDNQYLLYNSTKSSYHTFVFNSAFKLLGQYNRNLSCPKTTSFGNNTFIMKKTWRYDGYNIPPFSLVRCNINDIEFPLATDFPKIWTVLAGVSRYDLITEELNSPADHTHRLGIHLASTHYSENKVEPLIDRAAKKEDVLEVMKEVFNNDKVKEEDMLFFFFSGHGVIRNNDQGNQVSVLCTYDFNDNNQNTYLTHDDIMDVIDKSPAKHKIVMIEACQDASYLSVPTSLQKVIDNKALFDKQRGSVPEGTILITSCKEGEKSREDDQLGAIFSHFLLKGINEGLADGYNGGRKDGIITTKEIYTYIKDMVDNHCKENNWNRCQTTTISPSDYEEELPVFYLNH